MKDLLLPNFRVQFSILSAAELINYDEFFSSFFFLSGNVYFVTWLLLKCNCGHYMLPEKNFNQERVPFSKEKKQFNCHPTESENYCLKCYIIHYTGGQTIYAQVFLISTFMKHEEKSRQIVFAQRWTTRSSCIKYKKFQKAATPETKNSG